MRVEPDDTEPDVVEVFFDKTIPFDVGLYKIAMYSQLDNYY